MEGKGKVHIIAHIMTALLLPKSSSGQGLRDVQQQESEHHAHQGLARQASDPPSECRVTGARRYRKVRRGPTGRHPEEKGQRERERERETEGEREGGRGRRKGRETERERGTKQQRPTKRSQGSSWRDTKKRKSEPSSPRPGNPTEVGVGVGD